MGCPYVQCAVEHYEKMLATAHSAHWPVRLANTDLSMAVRRERIARREQILNFTIVRAPDARASLLAPFQTAMRIKPGRITSDLARCVYVG